MYIRVTTKIQTDIQEPDNFNSTQHDAIKNVMIFHHAVDYSVLLGIFQIPMHHRIDCICLTRHSVVYIPTLNQLQKMIKAKTCVTVSMLPSSLQVTAWCWVTVGMSEQEDDSSFPCVQAPTSYSVRSVYIDMRQFELVIFRFYCPHLLNLLMVFPQ